MIDTRRPDPNEIPPEACIRFTLPASCIRTLPGGKALVLVPLIAAQAFVRSLVLNLQQQGMWPADPPAAPPVAAPLLSAAEIDKAFLGVEEKPGYIAPGLHMDPNSNVYHSGGQVPDPDGQ